MKKILILEDSPERIAAFGAAWLRHDPLGVVWIGKMWLPKVQSYLA